MVRFFAPDRICSECANGGLAILIAVTITHYRHISVIHAAGSTSLRVWDQKELAKFLNGSLETRSALTKDISSLLHGREKRRLCRPRQ